MVHEGDLASEFAGKRLVVLCGFEHRELCIRTTDRAYLRSLGAGWIGTLGTPLKVRVQDSHQGSHQARVW